MKTFRTKKGKAEIVIIAKVRISRVMFFVEMFFFSKDFEGATVLVLQKSGSNSRAIIFVIVLCVSEDAILLSVSWSREVRSTLRSRRLGTLGSRSRPEFRSETAN